MNTQTQKLKPYALMALMLAFTIACKKDKENIDTEKPTIDLSAATAFPKQCSPIKRGSSFTFHAKLSDNVALGSYSIDVHHNFDHHSHSTEVEECTLEPVKKPVKPFVLVKSVNIPGHPQQYDAQLQIDVPADIDPGNYHFMIQVTDQSGWSTQRGISVRIVE
ncbi:DUF4625 domain-containing protein [Sphingobacterium puteale]|uniref:DUF4625 domain-containing protein n=1 Tax=Sphingobacterium puteale TaxID=2420510 RepID=A0A420VRC4_9SPHI|nr:DUF4625 domain-containing protein [Sphingobacterium puteale]RKO68906.1 DUF4625 domain-containing protein [Sphingobacterium puteale]